MLALPGVGGSWADRLRIATFGVRGMGSIFYIAYGQTHADFADIDSVWRIAALVILVSIVLHGFGAAIWMPASEDDQEGPDDGPRRDRVGGGPDEGDEAGGAQPLADRSSSDGGASAGDGQGSRTSAER